MASFDPRFALTTLLPIAEAAYQTQLAPGALPAGYQVVAPIIADAATTAAAPAAPQHRAILAKMAPTPTAFGWVLENPQTNTVVVAFRGTEDLDDWLHNLDFLYADYQPVPHYGAVHQGFQLYYLSTRQSVLAALKKVTISCHRLIITGHSLGGALTELAAPDLLHNGAIGAAGLSVPPEVQNFAGPRVGRHDFASLFDVQIDVCFRIVNLWDMVPNVPPALLFEHVGLAVKIDSGFTLDFVKAHLLESGYKPGLQKIVPPVAAAGVGALAVTAATHAAMLFPSSLLIGREP